MLVVDASALVAAIGGSLPDGDWVESLLVNDDLAAPELIHAEAMQVLRRLEFRGGISSVQADRYRRRVLQQPLRLFHFRPFADRVWELRRNVTVYDAWYVALAERLECPLVTLDLRLSRASGPTCEFVTPPDA